MHQLLTRAWTQYHSWKPAKTSSSYSIFFGSKAFAVVQNDLTGNITKNRTRYNAFPEKSKTLESLVENDIREEKKDATHALLWLTRGLHFTSEGLRLSQNNPGEELSISFTKGYEATLKQYHSFVMKPLLGLAMKARKWKSN
ncbi:hypothetical protein MJO29_000899 [Puccinia striiformis f. sp. tritici]|nr:hypothetical protein MJO29_000899 [Puccinia striiformis f. sp. tritici]